MSKLEDIMNGVVKQPTKEQINEALTETVNECKTLNELNNFLVKLHPTDAYRVITDIVRPSTNMLVRREQKKKSDDYKMFQNIQQESKRLSEYEQKNATIFDVKQISTGIAQQMYGIAVRMISAVDDELGRVEAAVNTIEAKVGLPISDFNEKESDSNDTTEPSNEQGSKETTD